MRRHITSAGDNSDRIARRWYGRGMVNVNTMTAAFGRFRTVMGITVQF